MTHLSKSADRFWYVAVAGPTLCFSLTNIIFTCRGKYQVSTIDSQNLAGKLTYLLEITTLQRQLS